MVLGFESRVHTLLVYCQVTQSHQHLVEFLFGVPKGGTLLATVSIEERLPPMAEAAYTVHRIGSIVDSREV